VRDWQRGDDEFVCQLQEIEVEYNQMFQNSVYKSHPTAIMTSKLINTKLITQKLQEQCDSKILDLAISTEELNIQDLQEQTSLQAQIQIPPK
jgi:hypothetical protein